MTLVAISLLLNTPGLSCAPSGMPKQSLARAVVIKAQWAERAVIGQRIGDSCMYEVEEVLFGDVWDEVIEVSGCDNLRPYMPDRDVVLWQQRFWQPSADYRPLTLSGRCLPLMVGDLDPGSEIRIGAFRMAMELTAPEQTPMERAELWSQMLNDPHPEFVQDMLWCTAGDSLRRTELLDVEMIRLTLAPAVDDGSVESVFEADPKRQRCATRLYLEFWPELRSSDYRTVRYDPRNSVWRWHDKDGRLVMQGAYRKGVRHGPWIDHSTETRLKGEYDRGLRHGIWRAYAGDQLLGKNHLDHGNGTWTEWYPKTGKPRERGPMRGDKKHGRWTRWKPDGQKIDESEYQEGKAIGQGSSWSSDGTKLIEATGDRRRVWWENGQLAADAQVDGDRHVVSGTFTGPDGKKLDLPQCPEGAQLTMHGPGHLAVSCRIGRMEHGPFMAWNRSGQPYRRGEYTKGRKTGVWTLWQHGTKTSAGKYDEVNCRVDRLARMYAQVGKWNHWWHNDGGVSVVANYDAECRLHGRYRGWHHNGQLQRDGIYQHGKMWGRWRQWAPDGRLRLDVVLKDGTGRWAEWHHDADAKATEGPIIDGVKAGVWTNYRKDGSLAAKGVIKNRSREGEWTIWDEDGKQSTAWFKQGREIERPDASTATGRR